METKKFSGLGSLSPNYYVSPYHQNKVFTLDEDNNIDKTLEKNIETKILIYEDRMNGWFLNFARNLTKERNSEFVVLMICISYLEGNQQFREGKTSSKGGSTKMLKKSLKRIFPEIDDNILDRLIDGVRQGLFHDGMTRAGILLRYGLNIPFFTFTANNFEWIELDPDIFLKEVQSDFKSYIETLKNKESKLERENFEKHYNEIYESRELNSKKQN